MEIQAEGLVRKVRIYFDADLTTLLRDGISEGIGSYMMERGIQPDLQVGDWADVKKAYHEDELAGYDKLAEEDPKDKEMWLEEKQSVQEAIQNGTYHFSTFWDFYIPEARYRDAPIDPIVDVFVSKDLDGTCSPSDEEIEDIRSKRDFGAQSTVSETEVYSLIQKIFSGYCYTSIVKGRDEPSPAHAINLSHKHLTQAPASEQFGMAAMITYHALTRMEERKTCEQPVCIYSSLDQERLQTHYQNTLRWGNAPVCVPHAERIQKTKDTGIISIDPLPLVINS